MTHPCGAGRGGRRGTGWTTQGETMACMVTFVSLAGVLSETFACVHAFVSPDRSQRNIRVHGHLCFTDDPLQRDICVHARHCFTELLATAAQPIRGATDRRLN